MKKNYLLHAILLLAALATAATMTSCSNAGLSLDDTILDTGPIPGDPKPWPPPYYNPTVTWSPFGEGEGGRELATGVRYTFTAYFADKVTSFRVNYSFAFYRSNGTRLSDDLITKKSDKEVSLVFPHPGIFRLVASVAGHPEIESHTFDFEVFDRTVKITGPDRAPVDSACYFIATINNPDYPFPTYEFDAEETYWNDPQVVCPFQRDPYTFGLTFREPGDYTVKSWVSGATKTTGEKKVIVEYRPYFKVRRFQYFPTPVGQPETWVNRIEFYRDEACTERLPRTEHRIRISYSVRNYHCDVIDGRAGDPVLDLGLVYSKPIKLDAGIAYYDLPNTTVRKEPYKTGYRIYWSEYDPYYYTPLGSVTILDDKVSILK